MVGSVKFFYNAEVHFNIIPTQFADCKLDHFLASYNILKFLKLCAETTYGRKFLRLPDPTVQSSNPNSFFGNLD
jgi:hypothetical protein